MDLMRDFVRDRTIDLQRLAADVHRERDLRPGRRHLRQRDRARGAAAPRGGRHPGDRMRRGRLRPRDRRPARRLAHPAPALPAGAPAPLPPAVIPASAGWRRRGVRPGAPRTAR